MGARKLRSSLKPVSTRSRANPGGIADVLTVLGVGRGNLNDAMMYGQTMEKYHIARLLVEALASQPVS